MNTEMKVINSYIDSCRSLCFCYALAKTSLKSQNKCANCHSKDILEEVKSEIAKAKEVLE